MNDLDDMTFARFAERFARIERFVPEPPRRAFAPGLNLRTGPATVGRRAILLGVVIILATMIALVAIGSRPAPEPTIPPDSAPPAVVLDAYLQALRAGDCDTARKLTYPLMFGPSMVDLCGVTDVTASSVTGGPVAVEPYKVMVQFTGTLTITGTANISAGEITFTYFLWQQSRGPWRIVDGGLHVPPSMLREPPPHPSP